MRGPQHRRLVERLAGELEGERQACRAVAATDRHRRGAGDVERHRQHRALEGRELADGVDSRRLARGGGGDGEIEIGHCRREFGGQLAAAPHRLDVVAAADQGGERHAVAEHLAIIAEPLAQRRLMDRVGLAQHDHHAAGCPIGERRQTQLAYRAAEVFEYLDGGGDALPRRLVRRIVVLVEVTDQPDAQSFDVARERGAVVGHRAVGARRVGGVVPGHRLQHDRAILRGPRHRAGMVEREGERQDAGAADPAIARLQPGETAKRGGAADRAAGVAAGAAEHEARGDRRPGAAARPAGEAARVPRVARRRPGQIERRAAEREFMGGELADHDRAGIGQTPDRCRILLRHMVDQDLRMAGRRHALGLVDVLEADRDAVQRAAVIAGHDLGLGAREPPRGQARAAPG